MRFHLAKSGGVNWKWWCLHIFFLNGCCSTLPECCGTLNRKGSCQWFFFNNTLIYGVTPNAAATLSECQSTCQAATTCQGIDWSPTNPAGGRCFLHTTVSGKFYADKVLHYDLGMCSDCVWNRLNNTNIPGGTENSATTVTTCQSACQSTAGCRGIDWGNSNSPGQQCYLLQTQSGKNLAPGVTHYDLNCTTAGGCTWTYIADTHILGGTENPATTVATCQSACQSTAGCQSIDWANSNPPGQQCYLLQTKSGKNPAQGVTHYDLSC